MTQDEIIRMAREAGFEVELTLHGERAYVDDIGITEQLERFAALVADSKKQQLINLCEHEIEQLSVDNDVGHVSRFDEGLYAAYHTILKGLLV